MNGQVVTCETCKHGIWFVSDRIGEPWFFYDDELLPLGGDELIKNEPKPKNLIDLVKEPCDEQT
jgi:hypothetical protein